MNNYRAVIANFVLLSILPFFTYCLSIIFLFFKSSPNKKTINLFIVNSSLLIAFINTTKVLNGDLSVYHDYFTIEPLHMSLMQFVMSHERGDYLFYIVTYILSYIFFQNWVLYIIFITFISYYFMLSSYKLVLLKLKVSYIDIIIVIITMTFFYLYFSLSLQLIRNYLAASMILYFLVNLFLLNENKYWYLILAISLHATASLFILVYIIRNFNYQKFLLLLIIGTILTMYRDEFYLMQRVMSFVESDEQNKNIFIFYGMFYSLLLVFIFLPIIKNKIDFQLKLNYYRYIYSVLIVFVVGFLFSNVDLVIERLILYLYFLLFPIYFLLLFKVFNVKVYRFLNITMAYLSIYLFYQNIEYGMWRYADISILYVNPLLEGVLN